MREWSLSTRHGAIVQPPRASWHPPVLEMVEALHKEAVGERVDALEVLVPDQLHGARGWVNCAWPASAELRSLFNSERDDHTALS
jgi:hypothetical protein